MRVRVNEAANRPGVIMSPEKTKSVDLISYDHGTQIFIQFHKGLMAGGSNAGVIHTDSSRINIEWLGEHTLHVDYPPGAEVTSKEDVVYFFRDSVTVHFREIQY
jgi:hypothetical protein